ncbi:hypothetical protein N825_23440 [Skermanella stibiiresistens SB22]|uniref:Elongation factor P hydroxylase n=1 Tax=Skermanella stibiiresistens SB22 TaxID=1385369 RepID=W9GSF1_9PROT|nr:hypothetical protein [Skermanella stibiiresistens]EWY36820.1 hypothetical protein N825_23440 [Skermanella stibiiresistens SB22]
MILTPIDTSDLPTVIERFERGLAGEPLAVAAFRRIAASIPADGDLGDQDAHRARAVGLAGLIGIETLDEAPSEAFSWDGQRIRTRSEPSVVIHEIAHWQLCAPERRGLYDFGLGAGPESGRPDEANAVIAVSEEERQDEEGLTSLLGILWEAELGQPAILAFLEQNWLEGYDRPATPAHFIATLDRLRAGGFVDGEGRPLPVGRTAGQVL